MVVNFAVVPCHCINESINLYFKRKICKVEDTLDIHLDDLDLDSE